MESSYEASGHDSSISDGSIRLKTPTSSRKQTKVQIRKEPSIMEIFKKINNLQKVRKLKTDEKTLLEKYKQQVAEALKEYEQIKEQLQDKNEEINQKDAKIEKLQKHIDKLTESNKILEKMIPSLETTSQIDSEDLLDNSVRACYTMNQIESVHSTPLQSKIPRSQSTPIVLVKKLPKDIETKTTPIGPRSAQQWPKEQRGKTEELNITQVMDAYLSIHKKKEKGDTDLKDKYLKQLKEKIQEILEKNEKLKEDKKQLEKQLQDNYTILTQAANDHLKRIQS